MQLQLNAKRPKPTCNAKEKGDYRREYDGYLETKTPSEKSNPSNAISPRD
jgi:hypothetical protein